MAAGDAKSGGTRIALAIGNAVYANAPALNNAKTDAHAIADKLRAIGFSQVTLADDLGFEAMRRELQQFGRAAAHADIAILYYAGHAIEIDGENYLVPTDAKLEHDRDAMFEALPLAQALRAIDGPGPLRLMILDACRDNPFTKMERANGRTRAFGHGLAEVEPGGNTLVAFAAKGGTVALDGDGPHSPFAQALIDLLPTPGLEVGFLFRQVRDAVLKATGRRQEPYLYGSLGSEPIFLAPEEAKAVPAIDVSAVDVFISYASADRNYAEALARDLEDSGYRTWWDSKLLGGERFRKTILAQLEAAAAAVVIWTRNSVESDWVYDEASRARAAKKLITVRVAELPPQDIQPPFGSLHAILLDDRNALRAALAARGVVPKQAAPQPAPVVRGPVDDRTVEHDYWVAIQASSDPCDFEMFLEQFPRGIYAPVARRRVEQLIASDPTPTTCERFLREHPASERALFARARKLALEWAEIEKSGDVARIRAFIAQQGEGAEVDLAKARLATAEWQRVAASNDPAEIEKVLPDLSGSPEAALASARLDALRREAAAWSAAAGANGIPDFEKYLGEFPAGAHAAEAKERLRALRSAEPIFNTPQFNIPQFNVPRFAPNWPPYLAVVIAGAILAVFAQAASDIGLYGIPLGDSTHLVSVHRVIYVGGMVAVGWRLAVNPSLLRVAALFVGLYVFEMAFEAIPGGNQAYTMFLNTVQMLIEWTIVAAVLLNLRDRLMFLIAIVFGALTGIVILVFDGTLPGNNYLINIMAYPATGICIAIGFLRQRPELKGTNWMWHR